MRSLIIIDGSNFYFKLKSLELNQLLKFDFRAFTNYLAATDKLVETCYYVGRIRQDGSVKTQKLFTSQQKLLAALKKSEIRYSLGYLLKNNDRYHEKGVDVQMAVDILVAAYENRCDKIIIVSSDTDLAPAIRKAREKKKFVEYIGFSHQPSVAMVSFCSSSRLITKTEINKFTLGNSEEPATVKEG